MAVKDLPISLQVINDKTLHVRWRKDLYQDHKIVNTEFFETDYELTEATNKELLLIRAKRKPTFILKIDGKLLYTHVPYNFRIMQVNFLGKHLCPSCVHFWSKSISPCPKINDLYFRPEPQIPLMILIKDSKRMEKYRFISVGYETINTVTECFVVVNCSQYKKSNKKSM